MTTARRRPAPALLVASVLGRGQAEADRAVEQFASTFGELSFVSEAFDFPWTDYYGDELGRNPRRRVVAVGRLVDDPGALPTVKRQCGRLEVAGSRAGQGRSTNIDPGLLTEQQLVLASTKPRAHRIYLDQGIYGELALIFRDDAFSPLPWTYPDYADQRMLGLFSTLRDIYLCLKRQDAFASASEGAAS